jgi:hypothetical protein
MPKGKCSKSTTEAERDDGSPCANLTHSCDTQLTYVELAHIIGDTDTGHEGRERVPANAEWLPRVNGAVVLENAANDVVVTA